MKKQNLVKVIFVMLVSILIFSTLASCSESETKVAFLRNEFEIKSGQSIEAKSTNGAVSYHIVGQAPASLVLDSNTGKITYDVNVLDGTQILVRAKAKDVFTLPVVVTLIQPTIKATYELLNVCKYYINGNFISIKATPNYALTYSMVAKVEGITIDSISGELFIDKSVVDLTNFAVKVVSKGGESNVFECIAKTENLITVEDSSQVTDVSSQGNLGYKLNLGTNTDVKVISVGFGTTTLAPNMYDYDTSSLLLSIKNEFVKSLSVGSSKLVINSSINSIDVVIKKADKIISTASELQAINKSAHTLKMSYILDADIDLTEYLQGEGNNDGKGWLPIGQYFDTAPAPTAMAFKGVFDGNGHTIKNIVMNRTDESGYNSGLFGYINDGAVIENLGVVGGTITNGSFTGALVGVNGGRVSNCYSAVTVKSISAEKVYRHIGGLVGHNDGTINDCYSISDVMGDTIVGALCGFNGGTLNNCFALASTPAFLGEGKSTNCQLFDTIEDMKKYSFAGFEANWILQTNELPQLNGGSQSYFPRDIVFDGVKDWMLYGEEMQLSAKVEPHKFDGVTKIYFSVENCGATISATNVLQTINVTKKSFVVTASAGGCVVTKTITLYEPSQSVNILNTKATINIGESVNIETKVLGEEARQTVTLKLIKGLKGVSLVDNKLTVTKYADDGAVIQIQASQDELKSAIYSLTVVGIKQFTDNTIVFTDTLRADAVFSIAPKVSAVMKNDVKIDFVNNAGTLTIAKAIVDKLPKGDNELMVICGEEKYVAHIKICDQIITTSQELIAINATSDSLGKYYVLNNDIDLQNKNFVAIGKFVETGEDMSFRGSFDGNGHTIKNFEVTKNSSDDSYNLGFFGYVTGSISNLTLSNGVVTGANFVGGIVGSLGAKAEINNCISTITVTGTGNMVGQFVGKNTGKIANCGYAGGLFCGNNVAGFGEISGTYVVG